MVGTSVGSCVTFLAFVNDLNICTGVFNHVSAYYADVVWTGLSTRYVRWGLEGPYLPGGPASLLGSHQPLVLHSQTETASTTSSTHHGKVRPILHPRALAKVFQQYRDHGIEHQRADLPCGHYTTASFPFSYLDAWWICRFPDP